MELDLFGADNSDLDASVLPLSAAVRRRKSGGLEVGDGSVLKQARNAAASVPIGAVEQSSLPDPPRTLPQAQAAAQGDPARGRSPTLGGLAAGYDTQLAEYQRQLQELNQDPDYSALAAQQRAKGQQGVQMLGAGIAAGMGPQDLHGLQGQFAQESARMMQPQKIEGGEVDVSGEVRLDPGYKRQKQIESLRTAIDSLEKHKLAATTAEERYRIEQAQHEMVNELRRQTIEMQRQANADRAQAAADRRQDKLDAAGGSGKMQAHGVTPDGRQISYSPTLGKTFVIDPTSGTSVEYRGPMMSQATADKHVNTAMDLQGANASIDAIDKIVRANKGAFGGATSLAALTPSMFESRFNTAFLTDAERSARTQVLQQAAMTMSALYGAAQSAGEAHRATAFIPDSKDNAETILTKLAAARAWQQSKLNALGPGFNSQARTISGNKEEAAPRGMPQVGEVVDGHRFKGGDPKQRSSWE